MKINNIINNINTKKSLLVDTHRHSDYGLSLDNKFVKYWMLNRLQNHIILNTNKLSKYNNNSISVLEHNINKILNLEWPLDIIFKKDVLTKYLLTTYIESDTKIQTIIINILDLVKQCEIKKEILIWNLVYDYEKILKKEIKKKDNTVDFSKYNKNTYKRILDKMENMNLEENLNLIDYEKKYGYGNDINDMMHITKLHKMVQQQIIFI